MVSLRLLLALAAVGSSVAMTLPHRRLSSTCLHTGGGYTCDYPDIGLYTPPTAVTAHASLDLDMQDILTQLGETPVDYTAAAARYNGGGLSQKPSKTIRSFSNPALMDGHKEYEAYKAYYGTGEYANLFVTGALDGTNVDFPGNGDANFGTVNDDATRIQGVKKGIVFLSFWHWALYEFEAGIDNCVAGQTGNTGAVHRWDEGVAFYTGSLQTTTNTDAGILMYALAQKRCANFKTCGANGGSLTGAAQANVKAFAAMTDGLAKLEEGSCTSVRPYLDNITAHGSVPFIQGALKYAWFDETDERSLKAKAEAATFAAAILPRVATCSAEDAAIIYDNLKLGATTTSFSAVKLAFERNYACMNITCADVGGYVGSDGEYKAGASPCTGNGPDATGLSTGVLIAIIAGGAGGALLLLIIVYFVACKKKDPPKA